MATSPKSPRLDQTLRARPSSIQESYDRYGRSAVASLWDIFGLYPVYLTPRWQAGDATLQVTIHLPRDYPDPHVKMTQFDTTWRAQHCDDRERSMVVDYMVD